MTRKTRESDNQERRLTIERLVKVTSNLLVSDGRLQTNIPFLSVARRSKQTVFTPGLLTPSICLVLQGKKRLHLGKEQLEYGAGEFLSSILDMPAIGQVVREKGTKPYIGIRIEFTEQEIESVYLESKIKLGAKKKVNTGVFVGEIELRPLEIFEKLLELLEKPSEVHFFANHLKREMIFRLLTGKYCDSFAQYIFLRQDKNSIGKVLSWIKENYTSDFTVEDLAKKNGISISTLHHRFKEVASMGPLQYQKQLKLQHARQLLLGGKTNVTEASIAVGYESTTQFNREYKKLFGLPPLRDVKNSKLNDSFMIYSEPESSDRS